MTIGLRPKILLAIAALFAVSANASVEAGAIIQPVAATSTIAGDAGSSVNYLIVDNPGFAAAALQRPTGTGVLLPTGETVANALATVHERSGSAHAESWTRGTGSGNPVFSFDLGSDMLIDSILLWQYGNGSPGNSTRDFELIFHEDAEGDVFSFASDAGTEASEFTGTMDAALPGTTANNVAQQFNFAPETARYVGLRIANNYLGLESPGGDRYGLGEVRFTEAAAPVPEPASIAIWSILGLCLAGYGYRRRRNG